MVRGMAIEKHLGLRLNPRVFHVVRTLVLSVPDLSAGEMGVVSAAAGATRGRNGGNTKDVSGAPESKHLRLIIRFDEFSKLL